LDERDVYLKNYALQKLDLLVEDNWAEIADYLEKMCVLPPPFFFYLLKVILQRDFKAFFHLENLYAKILHLVNVG
jgi:hypothetical protein